MLTGFISGFIGYTDSYNESTAAALGLGLVFSSIGEVFFAALWNNLRLLAIQYLCGFVPIGIPLTVIILGLRTFSTGFAAAMYFSLGAEGIVFVLTGFLLAETIALGAFLMFSVISVTNAAESFNYRKNPRSHNEKLKAFKKYTLKALGASAMLLLHSFLEMYLSSWISSILK